VSTIPEYIVTTTAPTYHGRILNSAGTQLWQCLHEDHNSIETAISCANEEIDRRERESTRRKRIRLPGIHADVVLEFMPVHPNGGEGVDMTIVESGNRVPGRTEVELTLSGVQDLIDALAEVAGLPYSR
jgi:hypothetical protein